MFMIRLVGVKSLPAYGENLFWGRTGKRIENLFLYGSLEPVRSGSAAGESVLACRPCLREQKVRRGLKSANFPVDFPCMHPIDKDTLTEQGYPYSYDAERPCPKCKDRMVPVTVFVHGPRKVVFRGECGHSWGTNLKKWLDNDRKFA